MSSFIHCFYVSTSVVTRQPVHHYSPTSSQPHGQPGTCNFSFSTGHFVIKRSTAPSRLSQLPITAPLLCVIHCSLAFLADLFDHRMFWMTCCLVFFGFLCVAEFMCPTTFDPSTHLTHGRRLS